MPADRENSREQTGKSGLALFLNLFPSIMLPMVLALIDQTIVATALPSIAGELGSIDRVSWVVVSYLLATTIAAPVFGRLGDLLGRKRFLFIAIAIFIVASLLCSVSTSVEMLAAFRLLQGFGGGGMMTISQALVGETVPIRDRPRYQGFLATTSATASTIGPVLGGLLTSHFGWRSIFLVNLPAGILALVLALRLTARPGSGKPLRFDFIGLLLFASFIVCSLIVLQLLQRLTFSDVLLILALLAISCGAAMFLVRRELRIAEPLLPLRLFSNPSIWRADALAVSHGATLISLLTFVPIDLRVVYGASADQIGLLLLPLGAGVSMGSIITGQLVSRTNRTAIFPAVAMGFVAALLLYIALRLPTLAAPELSVLLGVCAVLMGSVMGVVQVTVQLTAGQAMLGTAAASIQFSRSLGAALGTAIVSAVLFFLIVRMDPDAGGIFAAILQQGTDVLTGLPPVRREMIEGEIGSAFRAAFLTIAVFAGISSLLAWSIPLRRL